VNKAHFLIFSKVSFLFLM